MNQPYRSEFLPAGRRSRYLFLIIIMTIGLWNVVRPDASGAQTVVRVGLHDTAPAIFQGADGRAQGFAVDVLDYIAEQADWELEYIPGSWSQCMAWLQDGTIDLIVPILHTPDRDKILDFSHEALVASWGQVFVRSGSRIDSILDLKGKLVAGMLDDGYHEEFKSLTRQFGILCSFINKSSFQEVIQAVASGEADAGVLGLSGHWDAAAGAEIKPTAIVFKPDPVYFATIQGKGKWLLAVLDRHLLELKSNPSSVYYESQERWVNRSGRIGVPIWLKWTLGGAAVLLLAFSAFILLLRSQVRIQTREILSQNERLIEEASERGRAETALRESQAWLRAAVESLPFEFWAVGRDGRYVIQNAISKKYWGDIVGLSPEDLEDRVGPEVAASWRDCNARTLSGETFEKETAYTIHGELRRFHEIVAPVWGGDGIQGILGVNIDITDRVAAEKEMKALEQHLIQSQKMEAIGTLAGGIAHDFNNILAAVIGYTELARLGLPEHDPVRTHLDNVLKAGGRARDLVRQILTFSRQTQDERRPVDIGQVTRETLHFLEAAVPRWIEIRLQVGDDLGIVMADPVQIQQVVMNLCTNATQAMEDAGGVLEVTVGRTEVRGDSALPLPGLTPGAYQTITVRDTGHGMDPETLERAFEPFFTTKQPGQGTGLGLAVVHGIVRSLGGDIEAVSVPEGGTTFRVYLPSMDRAAVGDGAPGKHTLPTGHERILIVDDEAAVAEIGHNMLEHLGYRATMAGSSLQALEVFAADPAAFDMVITDFSMPDLNGLDLARRLKELRPDIPILLTTGYGEQSSMIQQADRWFNAFVMKPMTIRIMAETVRRVLDGKTG